MQESRPWRWSWKITNSVMEKSWNFVSKILWEPSFGDKPQNLTRPRLPIERIKVNSAEQRKSRVLNNIKELKGKCCWVWWKAESFTAKASFGLALELLILVINVINIFISRQNPDYEYFICVKLYVGKRCFTKNVVFCPMVINYSSSWTEIYLIYW